MADVNKPEPIVVRPDPLRIRIGPASFHRWATHFYKCKQDFVPPDGHGFSPVPYFLLCRAIELELKARHFVRGVSDVRKQYSHKLATSYNDLESFEKTLTEDEFGVLVGADNVYSGYKGFEYIQPGDLLRGFSTFPDLVVLDQVASKLIFHYDEQYFLEQA
ncbi:MAG TPA: hypothetical protein VFS30_07495 [Dehalococcoidia bacterium]|nr:hypothetical protein [Dehalococcoidia bacterium]